MRSVLAFLCVTGVLANSPPTFVKNIDLEVIKENTPIGTPAFQLVGTDPENSTVFYGLEGTDRFTVDKETGVITVAADIDRERNDSLRFYVTLEDFVGGGHDNNLVRVPVTVIVLDENDNLPTFQNVPYESVVKEDTSPGTTIFDAIRVTDADDVGGVLQIRCEFHPQFPDACDKFSIVPLTSSPRLATAALVLRRTLDYSDRHIYQVKLIADDARHNTTAAVVVNVDDVQNRPPVFIGSLTGIVNEDDPVGTLVMKVKARDGDEGNPRNITYDLVTNPEEFFSVDPISGELHTIKPLDKEIFSSSNGVINVGVKATEMENGVPAEGSDTSAVAALTITIRDVNDEAPTFNKISYTVNVNENVPNGTPLPNLDMFVQDTDVGSNSVFNIELIDDSGIFSVEPPVATGSTSVSIRVANGPLDYENPNQRKFIILVVAKEAFTDPQLSGTGTVTVNIVDTNDNVPKFEKQEYRSTVMETAPPGTVVDTITAMDRDTRSFGEAGIIYSLFGNGAERFHVGPSSGVITVAPCPTPGSGNCLDYETRPTYYLSYQAVDDNGKGQAAVVSLTIILTDANDNAPFFIHDSYTAIIDEGATKFDPPLRVQAVDADATSVPLYTIIAGNNQNLFTIDGRSGEISVTEQTGLDVSDLKTDLIILTVQASDGGKGIATTTVKITVKDANNNSPIFQKTSYVAKVPESSPPGTIVDQVSASDADTGINALISYRIQKGGFDDFSINSTTGIVTVGADMKLDYDRRKEYSIEIVAVDSGSPIHTGTTTLTVQILNNNDKAPYFTPSTQRTQVSEGEDADHVFYRLEATDPDVSGPDSLKFAIAEPVSAIDKDGRQLSEDVKSYKNFFEVNANNGDVRVSRRLDRDLAAIVTMTVLVTDISATPQQTGTGTLVVTIVDVNDYPPAFARPWTPDRPELSINVMEEQPGGSVVATLVATDPDSNIAAYVIEPENQYFDIDKASGVITIKSRVDYEAVHELKFTVVAYDTGVPQLSAVALVTANVININDNDPVFNESSYHATLLENSPQNAIVTQVMATDADAGEFGVVRYSLLGERSPDFTVDQQGIIRVAAAATLDREVTPSITLQVVATDQGSDVSTRRAISVPIYIVLLDVNDNPPLFTQKEYEASIVANIPTSPPSPVVQVSATDRDEGENAKVVYSITAGNEKGIFRIDRESGVIFPDNMLEENVKNYKLRVQAQDMGGDGPNVDEAIVHIKVVEVNQDKPKFMVPALPNATVDIPENQSIPNFLVLTVEAEDKDRGENGRVSYYLKVGDTNVEETEEFHINTVTGELRTKIILDREKVPKYQLVLAARDNGSPTAFETLRFLTVILKDVDDNSPEFPRSQTTNPYVFTIEENLPSNFPVGQVVAKDRDVGQNALIYYYIIDGNYGGYFQVEKTSGILKSNTSFDREEREMFEIVVKATSNPDYMVYERPEESGLSASIRSYREEDLSLAWVRILVSDVNDNIPHFINTPYLAGLRYSTQVGDVVATVSAVDPDSGPNGTLTYRLENINLFRLGVPGSVRPIPSPFNISNDGRIIATQLMAQYDHARFVITASARELAHPSRVARATVKLWVYEPNQLVRVIVAQPPEEVNKHKKLVHEILSNATRGAVVIDDIRYHVNDENKLVRKWTDLYIHVVNDHDEMMLIPQVLEAVDSNSKMLSVRQEEFHIHKVVPAYVGVLEEELDIALVALIALLVVIFVGVITMIVCCLCLKKWYTVKIHEALIRHDDVDPGNTTENPLWTEQKLKLYEEQELSMSVAPDQDNQVTTEVDVATINFGDDAESAVYATLRKSTAGSIGRSTGSRLGTFLHGNNEYSTLNGCTSGGALRDPLGHSHHQDTSSRRQRVPGAESHEYHELHTRHPSDERSVESSPLNGVINEPIVGLLDNDLSQSTLTIDKDGEPVLVAELL